MTSKPVESGDNWSIDLSDIVGSKDFAQTPPFAADPRYEGVFDQIARALHRECPSHLLLVRESGVGEQAIALEIAARGKRGQPSFLCDHRFYLLNCRNLTHGEHASVISAIFSGAEMPKGSVLFVDGFAQLIAEGPSRGSCNLRAALTRTDIRVIGFVSPREFDDLIIPEPTLASLFSPVMLFEPDVEAAVRLVRYYSAGLQAKYSTIIDESAVDRAVRISANYIINERLPSKALRILQRACDRLAYDRSQLQTIRSSITAADVTAEVSEMTGLPAVTLEGTGESTDFYEQIRTQVVGQDDAVREVATELGLIKAGMSDPAKPASVMLFIGQTGTGKTELAKVLARLYSTSRRLKTFTLGNFSEPHSVSGIIGVPAGYVGHDQGGRLINELNSDPYGVFLLDEADKAHPDVMQPFLNLFDEGWIADQRGNRAHASRAIFVLTTNVGQRQLADMCRDGASMDEIKSTMKDTLSRVRHTKSNRPVFAPEFLARIKRLVIFRSLDQAAMNGIARRLVNDLRSDWWLRRQKEVLVSQSLIDVVARKSHEMNEKSQGREGGRVVRKLIADDIEVPLQVAILADPRRYREAQHIDIKYDPGSCSTAPSTSTIGRAICDQVTVTFS